MQEYIIFLRGINVGGHRKVLMKDLKLLLEANGYHGVKTYIQSGNIYLRSNMSKFEIKMHIQNLIFKKYTFEVIVFVVSGQEIKDILANDPFKSQDGDLYYSLVDKSINLDDWRRLLDLNSSFDKIQFNDSCIYLLCSNGYGNTKFSNPFIEKILKLNATTRNRKTMQAMVDLLH
jgi:uncharacterized protein (DUF1697 family)